MQINKNKKLSTYKSNESQKQKESECKALTINKANRLFAKISSAISFFLSSVVVVVLFSVCDVGCVIVCVCSNDSMP